LALLASLPEFAVALGMNPWLSPCEHIVRRHIADRATVVSSTGITIQPASTPAKRSRDEPSGADLGLLRPAPDEIHD